MARYVSISAWLALFLVLTGCGGGNTAAKNESDPIGSANEAMAADGTNSSTSPDSEPQQELLITVDSKPEQVVTAFLEAMRSGDSEAIEQLITSKARDALRRENVLVDPIADSSTQYKVAGAKYVENNPDACHIACELIGQSDDGTETTYEMHWVLAHEKEIGWRVMGMALELVPGSTPQFLNFEDPKDMLKKKEQAIAEAEKAAAAESGKVADTVPMANANAAENANDAVEKAEPKKLPAAAQAKRLPANKEPRSETGDGEGTPNTAVKPAKTGSALRKR